MEIKTVLITGATSGIGKACACKFAKEGWNLILNARAVGFIWKSGEKRKVREAGSYCR